MNNTDGRYQALGNVLRQLREVVLRQIRNDRGWGQKDLAKDLGFEQPQIAKWENGDAKPSVKVLRQYVELMKLCPNQMALLQKLAHAPDNVITVKHILPYVDKYLEPIMDEADKDPIPEHVLTPEGIVIGANAAAAVATGLTPRFTRNLLNEIVSYLDLTFLPEFEVQKNINPATLHITQAITVLHCKSRGEIPGCVNPCPEFQDRVIRVPEAQRQFEEVYQNFDPFIKPLRLPYLSLELNHPDHGILRYRLELLPIEELGGIFERVRWHPVNSHTTLTTTTDMVEQAKDPRGKINSFRLWTTPAWKKFIKRVH